MLSQTSSEGNGLYSTTYVESFLDAAQDMPDDLQKLLSRMREYDTDCHRNVKEADRLMDILLGLQDKEDSEFNQKQSAAISLKLQNLLISTQEIGDEKLQIVQQIQDMLENKSRKLELEQKHTEVAKPEQIEPVRESKPEGSERKRVRRAPRHDVFVRTSLGPTSLEATSHTDQSGGGETHYRIPASASSSAVQTTSHAVASTSAASSSSHHHHHTSSSSGNPERGGGGERNSTGTTGNKDSHDKSWNVSDRSSNPSASGSGSGGGIKKQVDRRSDADKKKYKRRKATSNTSSANNKQSGSSNSPPNLPIDPDEPTYCLCDQVSYGEMIGCDNDLCPIEWFHFQCVALTSKPKGKWYCPKCRGDRPTLMKPKAVFLKELEKYNREKEEKA